MTTKSTGYKKGKVRIIIILDAAENLLIESGYHNFSLRKVATKAKISVGNLQYYFPTKEKLLDALLDRVIQGYIALYEEMRQHGTPEEQFSRIIEHVITDMNTKRTTIFFPELWSLANHDKSATKQMDNMYGEYRKVLTEIIGELNPSLSIKQTERLSLFISSSAEGFTMFMGYQKPWRKETKNIIKMSIQSFIWLIRHGEIPK